MFTRFSRSISLGLACAVLSMANVDSAFAQDPSSLGVGPQYDTTHVYVAPQDFDRFTASILATFGGKKSPQGVFQVTPTPSQTMSQLVLTPVGTISVFGFKTPIPFPFGSERTGYLVTDMDAAVSAAHKYGADIVVTTFPDPIGRDAVVEWPGGVHMQMYWHKTAPHYDALQTIPENRVYVSQDGATEFARAFTAFSHGKIVSDEAHASGVEVGRPDVTIRRIRLESIFGKVTIFATDGQLPYPYGREMTGYEVTDLDGTLAKAKTAGVAVLVPSTQGDHRMFAILQFPGGYIAEVHSPKT